MLLQSYGALDEAALAVVAVQVLHFLKCCHDQRVVYGEHRGHVRGPHRVGRCSERREYTLQRRAIPEINPPPLSCLPARGGALCLSQAT